MIKLSEIIYRADKLNIIKNIFIVFLFLYALLLTFYIIRTDSKPLLVGISDSGTYLITDANDRLLKKEKQNFILEFIGLAYNYNSKNYSERVSKSGDYISERLWVEKSEEYKKIEEGLKNRDITQSISISEIRQVSEWDYQADTVISIRESLNVTKVTLLLTIKLSPQSQTKPFAPPYIRSRTNPYPYQIEALSEQQI